MRYFFFVRYAMYGLEEVELSSRFIFKTNEPIIYHFDHNSTNSKYLLFIFGVFPVSDLNR